MTQVKQKIQPYIPMPLKAFYKKRCKDMYNLLTREKKKQITSVINWREKGNDMNEFDISEIFLNFHLKLLLNLNSNGCNIKYCIELFLQIIISIKLSFKTLLFVTSVN